MATSSNRAELSIGDLAERTGIAPDTLRAWERRYGEPEPVRLESGHRRYTEKHVRRLRRVAEAIALGHRPSKLLRMSDRAIDALLAEAAAQDKPRSFNRLLDYVAEYRRAPLRRELRRYAKDMTPEEFIIEILGPLTDQVGRAWADGRLEVRHEHFYSETVEDLLRSLRLAFEANIEQHSRTPPILLATLSGERHDLGLQMAAFLVASCGSRCRILGTETPADEIVHAVAETGARALGISVSLASGGPAMDRQLRELRAMIPDEVTMFVGGAGARGIRRGSRGILYFPTIEPFVEWLTARTT